MSIEGILTNISYHKEQINNYRETLLGILYQLQNNDYFTNYINSLKNIIYNINYLNINESISCK